MPAAEKLWNHGLHFIGVIRTSMLKYPTTYLSNINFQNWGDMSIFLTRPVGSTKMVLGDFVWMDWNKRYLIFTGVSTEKGWSYTCMRWKQEDHAPNVEPNTVEPTIPKTITADIYFSACGQIYRHNR